LHDALPTADVTEFIRIRKEAVVANIKAIFQHVSGITGENRQPHKTHVFLRRMYTSIYEFVITVKMKDVIHHLRPKREIEFGRISKE
jgi:hypothetical protein